jgi:hypothetical protein
MTKNKKLVSKKLNKKVISDAYNNVVPVETYEFSLDGVSNVSSAIDNAGSVELTQSEEQKLKVNVVPAIHADGLKLVDTNVKNFRFQGASVVLTYSQIGDTPLSVFIDSLNKALFTHTEISLCLGSVELHKDGGRHCHIYISFSKRLRLRNAARFFDVENFHPNLFVPHSKIRSIRYVMKGINSENLNNPEIFYSSMDHVDLLEYLRKSENTGVKEGSFLNNVIDSVVKSDMSLRAGVTSIVSSDPGKHLLNVRRLEESLNLLKEFNVNKLMHYYMPFYVFSFHKSKYFAVSFWFAQKKKTHVLCLMGPTNTGKSTLAAQLLGKNPFFVTDFESLSNFSSSAYTGICFNDFAFNVTDSNLKDYLNLFDPVFECNFRVRFKSVLIPGGMAKIVTTNDPLDDVLNKWPSLSRRFLFVFIDVDMRSGLIRFNSEIRLLKYCVDSKMQPRRRDFHCRSLPSIMSFFSAYHKFTKKPK